MKIVTTGSSALDLAFGIIEPLTGRKWEFNLFPLSFGEMAEHNSLIEEKRLLHHRLVFGCYPDVVTNPGDEAGIIR